MKLVTSLGRHTYYRYLINMNPGKSRRFKLTRYMIIHNHNTTDLLLVKILYMVQGRLSSVFSSMCELHNSMFSRNGWESSSVRLLVDCWSEGNANKYCTCTK